MTCSFQGCPPRDGQIQRNQVGSGDDSEAASDRIRHCRVSAEKPAARKRRRRTGQVSLLLQSEHDTKRGATQTRSVIASIKRLRDNKTNVFTDCEVELTISMVTVPQSPNAQEIAYPGNPVKLAQVVEISFDHKGFCQADNLETKSDSSKVR